MIIAKKNSLVLVIISSIGIILGQIMNFVNSTIISQRVTAGSFIGLGIGAILFGVYMLKSKEIEQ